MVVKHQKNATRITGAVVGGLGAFDTTRVVNVGNVGGVATATQRFGYVSPTVKFSQLLDFGNAYIMPSIAGSSLYMHQRAFTETGGGLANLMVDQRSQLYWSVAPNIEAGGEIDLGNSALRAKAKVGLLHQFGDDPSVSAALVGTPAGVASFVTQSGRDDTLLTLDAGLDWIGRNGVNLRIDVGGQLGEHTKIWQGSTKLTIPLQ